MLRREDNRDIVKEQEDGCNPRCEAVDCNCEHNNDIPCYQYLP